MEIYIRKAVIEDFAAVRNIIQQVHDMHVNWRPDIHRRNDDLFTTEYFEKFLAEDAFYVAVTDGRVVGVLSLVFRHIESPAHVTRDVVFIDTMAVDEGYRGRGIGHLFFETVKEIKTKRKYDGIELQVNAKNRAAYEMYRHYGFTDKSINMELLEEKLTD